MIRQIPFAIGGEFAPFQADLEIVEIHHAVAETAMNGKFIDRCGTPRADREWTEFRALRRGVILGSFHQHYARLVEILYGIERIEQLLHETDSLDKHVRAFAKPNKFEGIGVAEAPRGTLIHHYKIDEDGLIKLVNMSPSRVKLAINFRIACAGDCLLCE